MRIIEFKPVSIKLQTTFFETIETIDQARAYLGGLLTTKTKQLLQEAAPKVEDEKRKGFTPNLRIDFETGDIYPMYFPIGQALAKAGYKKQSGVSICVVTADDYVVGIRRSLENGSNRGAVGCVAGYVKFRDQANTIGEYVTECFLDECEHEIGVRYDEIESDELVGYVDVGDQDEAIVIARLKITKDTLKTRLLDLESKSACRLAEQDVFFMTQEQAWTLVSHEAVRGASQHLFALLATCFSSGIDDDVLMNDCLLVSRVRDGAISAIKQLPHSPDETFNGLVEILDEIGITERTF